MYVRFDSIVPPPFGLRTFPSQNGPKKLIPQAISAKKSVKEATTYNGCDIVTLLLLLLLAHSLSDGQTLATAN